MIHLYTAETPNGHKVSIALEEMDLPYEVHHIDFKQKQQKQPEFLKINPNGRIPAIIDDGFTVFESGAILLYLAEKTGQFLPTDARGRSRVVQWLMFQMSGIGPMMGQANVFFRYLPEKIQLAIDRYQGEVRRLFGVLDGQLASHEFLAGDYSIADMATWPWVRFYDWAGVSIEPFPNVQRWLASVGSRPGVQRGVNVPEDPLPRMLNQDAQELVRTAAQMLEMGRSNPKT